jgi:uncharacterized protein YjbI with pentapeptide repeats
MISDETTDPADADGDRRARTVLTDREKAELRGQTLQDRSFDGLDLTGADLSFATFVDCSFVGCSLRQADLRHARFRGCDLRWAAFDGARLGKNRFDGSTLGGAKGLRRHDVRYVRRQGASFSLDEPFSGGSADR